MDVSEAVVDYLAAIEHLPAGTRRGYQYQLTVFADWCAAQGLCLEQINNRAVQSFLHHLRATHRPQKHGRTELSTVTISNYVRMLWVFLRWCAVDDEYSQYVTFAQVKKIKMPRVEQHIKQTFTDEEVSALFNACQHESKKQEFRLRDTAILALFLDCGLRATELRTLTIGNVVFANRAQDDSYITVMGKGRKQREIPLGNRARRALHRYMREYRKGASKTDVVFASRYGNRVQPVSLKYILLRLRALSGLPSELDVNPHKFRHTFATRFMANGGDVYDLSRLLGHSSVAVTEHYIKSLSSQQVRTRKTRLSVLDNL